MRKASLISGQSRHTKAFGLLLATYKLDSVPRDVLAVFSGNHPGCASAAAARTVREGTNVVVIATSATPLTLPFSRLAVAILNSDYLILIILLFRIVVDIFDFVDLLDF